MSDKERNTYYDYQNLLSYYPFFPNDQSKCLICLKPIQIMYQAYQLICNECMQMFYARINTENTSLPPVITPAITSPEKKNLFPKILTPSSFPYPQNIIHSMIFICDFIYQFTDLIKIQSFSLEMLYNSVQKQEVDHLISEISVALTSRLVINLLKNDAELKFNKNSKIFTLAQQILDIVDIKKTLNIA